MQKNEENVLVIRRALFDDLGAFQGLERDADRYIETFMTRQNNFFLPRSRAEQDPAFKQIIPYAERPRIRLARRQGLDRHRRPH